MPKPKMIEARFDWTGGLNTQKNPDTLGENELLTAQNVRLAAVTGAFQKRSGCKRMHATSINSGDAILGLFQWDAPGGKQVIAVTATKFAHKTSEFGDFTVITLPGSITITGPISFQAFRDTSDSAALVLYIATGTGEMLKWTGSALTDITGVNGVPQTTILKAFHTRIFAVDERFLKNAQWSDIGTGATWNSDPPSGGGSNVIDTLTGEGIVAMELVGRSLAIATEDSIVRFTGYSGEDILIQQDTEGISSNHGPMGQMLFRRFEGFIACLTDRGMYVVSEGGAQKISRSIDPEFDNTNRNSVALFNLQYHRGRRELWTAVRHDDDSAVNSVFVYNAEESSWTGPWLYTFAAIQDMARYEDSNGDEWLMAGFDDGFVRHMDFGTKDDVLSDGSGGTNITMSCDLAPIFFESGPYFHKSLRSLELEADLATSGALKVFTQMDGGAFVEQSVTGGLSGVTGVTETTRIDLDDYGKRCIVRFTDASATIPIVQGFQIVAINTLRH